MRSRPILSVIIPVFNGEPYLSETLLSISQGFSRRVEVIVIDDGSTDSTSVILEDWKEKLPGLKILRQENLGLSASRNRGLSSATGLYGVFLDADDLLDLVRLVTFLEMAVTTGNHIDLVLFDTKAFSRGQDTELLDYYSNYYRRPSNLSVFRDQALFEQLVAARGLRVSACLYAWRTDFLRTNEILFREKVIMEDNAFTFRCFSRAKSAVYLPVSIHRRRVSNNSLSNSSSLWKIARGYWFAFADSLLFLIHQENRRRWQSVFVMRLMLSVAKHFYHAMQGEISRSRRQLAIQFGERFDCRRD